MKRLAFCALAATTLFSSGCSDPEPPLSQAGLHFTVRSSTQGGQCPVIGNSYGIGSPPPLRPVELRNVDGAAGKRIIDGQHDSEVSCRVAGKTNFEVRADMTGRNTSPSANVPSAISFEMRGGVAAPETEPDNEFDPGYKGETTLLSFYTNDTKRLEADMPCTISVEEAPLEIGPGRMFATFDCPSLISPGTLGTRCQAEGTIVIENCSK